MRASNFLALAALTVAVAIAAIIPEEEKLEDNAIGSSKKVICYYGSWAVYRPEDGKFEPENIDPFMCTHLIYGFVGLGFDNRMRLLDAYLDICKDWGRCAMERFNRLKKKNPKLKTLLAIGGWNEGSEKYSRMVSDANSRRIFIQSVVEFLPTVGFDGFDLDWEYPAHRGGKPEDKENYDLLLKEMRAEFDKHGYLLSAAVSAGEDTIRNAYNVPSLAKYLDFVNVMSYDFHGAWDFHKYTHHNAPLYEHPMDKSNNNSAFNIDHAVNTWHSLGLPKAKIMVGLASYGRGFLLNNWRSGNNKQILYAPANQGIEAGPYTRERGYWGYNEICKQIRQGGWEITRDKFIQAPIGIKKDMWIGYDDPESIATKAAYARDNGFGGVMVWSLETDDFRARCHQESFPLIKTMHRVMIGDLPVQAPEKPSLPVEVSPAPQPSVPPVPSVPSVPTTTMAPPVPSRPDPPRPIERPPPADKICQHEGHNRDPEDCNKFYHCKFDGRNWLAITFRCGEGTAFNAAVNACDFPWNVPGCL